MVTVSPHTIMWEVRVSFSTLSDLILLPTCFAGTHCTGTIAATDNDVGVVGVAPNVEIFVARVFSPNGEFHSSDMIAGLQACADGGANVISMSLGGPFANSQEQAAFRTLYERGIVSVAAAGNTGRLENIFPASYENVISVAAVDSNGRHASFSTRNNRVDVAAPGVSVVSDSCVVSDDSI